MAFISGGLLERINEICGEGLPAKFDITPEGGFAVLLTNKTGAASVKGTLVEVYDDTAIDNAFDVCEVESYDPIGAVYEDGVADGSECWVVTGGIAEVLLKDATAATREYWAKTSDDTAGRADITNAAPLGGTVAQLRDHFQEIGHALESVSAGSDVLCKIVMHFN